MSKESTHLSSSLWFQLPTQLRHHVMKTFLNHDDAITLALTCRQATRDMDVCLGQMMCTGKRVSFHPKAQITTDKLVASLPAHWQVTCLSSAKDNQKVRLALMILCRAPVRWLAIYLDQIAHYHQIKNKQRELSGGYLAASKEARFSFEAVSQWTPWDWVALASAIGRENQVRYLFYRWQIVNLDRGRYRFTLPSVSIFDFVKYDQALTGAYFYTATPLQIATFQCSDKIIRLLLHYGDSDFTYEKDTALTIAVCRNSVTLAKKLVNRGANPNLCLPNTCYNFSPYLLAIRSNRAELVRYFMTLKRLCVWHETNSHTSAYDIMYAPAMNTEISEVADPKVSTHKRWLYACISAFIGLILCPVIVLAETLHGIKHVVINEIPSQMQHAMRSGLLEIGIALLFLPLMSVINVIVTPFVGLFTGFQMGWRYQQKTLVDLACYSRKMATTLSLLIQKLPLGSAYQSYKLYVTHAPEYYYLSFGAILTGTFTLLAALHVFSPLILIFPVLNTWPAWQVVALTAVAGIAVASTICGTIEVIRSERMTARMLSNAAARKKPDTLLDEKTLYERLHLRSTEKQRTDTADVQGIMHHRSVSVFDQAPVLKQAADGQLMQLSQLTI